MKQLVQFAFSLSCVLAWGCLAVATSSCTGGENPPEPEPTYQMEVTDVTHNSATLSVTPSDDNVSYYCGIMLSEEYVDDSSLIDYVIEKLEKESSETGIPVGDIFITSTRTGSYFEQRTGLCPQTGYMAFAFRLDADGNAGEIVTKKEFTTSESPDYYGLMQVGDYLMADGSILFKDDNPSKEDLKDCIGIVFYVGHHENDMSDYTETGIGHKSCNGYAVALTDAKGDAFCGWGEYGVTLGNYPADDDGNPINNLADGSKDIDWSGFLYTCNIVDEADMNGGLSPDASESVGYPATYYALDYANKVPAPETSSGWYLPSISQLKEIYDNMSSLDFGSADGYRPYYKRKDKDAYWSSSELFDRPESSGLRIFFSDGGTLQEDKAWGKSYVRSVISF